ncbi:bifunctional serine/threonine-protein kinase/formylglycine-generating enzyme family protein [Kamptonema formosum]|uniref:bifunctional serine/threonine-protein kinase/formylglycine-generating enzyme family protein n=1 Tax=Kamptonema formosum TaxID=331992 RepID=UPI00037E3357|nr:bifunctional serine/threonine-protein kinase/formylglycine-generating enzyme family protein [Oscillatoria sp. PCC 10802]
MRCLHCLKDGIALKAEVCPNCGVHLPTLLRDVLPNSTQLRGGTYEIEYALGRGGFGITYRAHHTLLEQIIALKEFYPKDWAIRNPSTGSLSVPPTQEETYQRGKERFLREGRILAKLSHPNVVGVRDLFEERGTAYLVMELIAGKTLRQELDAQPDKKLPARRVAEIMEQLVAALQAVHDAGVYHLDIKPENILLTPDSRAVVIDFGAAKQAATGQNSSGSTRSFSEAYAAPEIIARQPVGAESDIFELGMVLHEMLTGTRPEPALSRLLMGDSYHPAGLAEPWQNLVAAALVLQKEKRPSSVRQWWESLTPSPPNPLPQEEREISIPPTPFLAEAGKGGEGKTSVAPSAPTPLPPEEKGGKGKSPLQIFEFEVVTVNARGREINRSCRQAEFFPEDLGGGIILEMVSIPGGSFLMGSPNSERERYDIESPQHRVSVQPFYMGKYPVTQAQWNAVASFPKVSRDLDPDPSQFKGENRPVECVSWQDAAEFCARLSRKTGRNYRLPSEAEWEYACRAGTATPFHFGETITADLANYESNYTYASAPKGKYREETAPVGSFPPNAFGLYNTHGNVWEWCADPWHDNYAGAPPDGSVWEIGGNKDRRVQRGGSWYSSPRDCRAASRNKFVQHFGRDNVGFRAVVSLGRTP